MALFSKKQTDVPRRREQPTRATETSLEERYTFRRNRTLTGSVSSNVISTNESKAELKSARVHGHDLARQRRHIGATLLLVLAIAGTLYFLISQFTATAKVQSTGDVTTQLDSSYGKLIQDYLGQQPIERLRFLMSDEHFNEYIQSRAPEIASIKADGSAGFGASRFEVSLREPIAGWSIDGKQQYVDATGISFTRNYFATPAVQIVDQSGIHVQSGQAVASNSFLSFVGRAVGFAKQSGYKVTQVIIPAGTTREVDLKLDGMSYSVKFSIDRGAGEQMEDMSRAIDWMKSHGQNPEYIDVRVGGKAFYR